MASAKARRSIKCRIVAVGQVNAFQILDGSGYGVLEGGQDLRFAKVSPNFHCQTKGEVAEKIVFS